MKQVWIVATGGPEKLQLREAPDLQPRSGELRIRVRASGINFADILARKGLYPDAPKLPAVVGNLASLSTSLTVLRTPSALCFFASPIG